MFRVHLVGIASNTVLGPSCCSGQHYCVLNDQVKESIYQVWELRETKRERDRPSWCSFWLWFSLCSCQLAKKHIRWYFLSVVSHLIEKCIVVLSKCEHKIVPTPCSEPINIPEKPNWRPGPVLPKETSEYGCFHINGREAHPGGPRSALGFKLPLPFTSTIFQLWLW